MSHSIPAALLLTFASCAIVLGQQPNGLTAGREGAGATATTVRGQSPEAIPVDYRSNSELLENAEYRDLLDGFDAAQAELARLRENLNASGIEDHGDHFNFASYEMNNELFQE